MCSDVIKNLNVKVFNLISITNGTRYIVWHETCKCICRLSAGICNSWQIFNKDKCRCECKELVGKRICDKGFIWNSSACECECDKSCNIREYLHYKNCKCRYKLVDKLFEECTKTIDGNEIICNETMRYFWYTIHCVVCSDFNNECNNWCFCLFSLVFKKRR